MRILQLKEILPLQKLKIGRGGFIGVKNRLLAFKNNAPFTDCISKINGVLIDNAENLDAAIPMCNLLEYSKSYRKATGSLRNYHRDEPSYFPANNCNTNPITTSESFKYKTSITRRNIKCQSQKW